MDLDFEIISEEAERPDPLFGSIMNAMNSMKEATADKIYQKIQKEGATNYSKPQVDRALASALKYGIFEVRNNRYRVRDDVLDDEDTVYWKFQKTRDQTPFRIQEDINEKHGGPKLDPEKDNQRFRRPPNKSSECPHCGRTKRPEGEEEKAKISKVQRASAKKRQSKNERWKNRNSTANKNMSKRRMEYKRKKPLDSDSEKSAKRRKSNAPKNNFTTTNAQGYCNEARLTDYLSTEKIEYQEGTPDSSESEMEVFAIAEHKPKNNEKNKNNFRKRNKEPSSAFSSECIKSDLEVITSRRSSTSIKTESESEKTYISSLSDDQSQSRTADGFFEDRPCTSRNASGKVRNQYLQSTEMYRNQYERAQTDQGKRNPDWLGCSDEPQGAIIQSNNVLTIEPMDSLVFKNPEQASYIS